MSYYSNLFQEWHPEHDPRHIEAYVRLQYPTLNSIDTHSLRREAGIAAECIIEGGVEAAEQLAASFGLDPPEDKAVAAPVPGPR